MFFVLSRNQQPQPKGVTTIMSNFILLQGPVVAIVSEIIIPKRGQPYAISNISAKSMVKILDTCPDTESNSVCTFSLNDQCWVDDFWPGEKKYNETCCSVILYGIYDNNNKGLRASVALSK